MNKTITFCGNILVDSVKMVASWPKLGMLAQITDLQRAVGGSVCNTGVDLKTLDPSVTVRALGKVGEDDAGDFAVSVLDQVLGRRGGRLLRGDALFVPRRSGRRGGDAPRLVRGGGQSGGHGLNLRCVAPRCDAGT